MSWNSRLMVAAGVVVLLASAAFSQIQGGGPAGMDPGGISSPQPGFETPPQEGAEARKAGDSVGSGPADAWEDEQDEVIDLGPWSQARDIFHPGRGAGYVPQADQPRSRTSDNGSPESVRLPVLHGVMTGSDEDKVAILDTNMVREGDFCDGFKIRSIRPKRVVLVRDGKEYVLYVKE